MIAPGPFAASELPFLEVSVLPFAVAFVPAAVMVLPLVAFADDAWPFKRLLPGCAKWASCSVLDKAASPEADEPSAAH